MVKKTCVACLFIFFSLAFHPFLAIAREDKGVTLGLTQSRVKETLREIDKASFHHPVSLQEKDISRILQSLYYSTYVREFGRWEHKEKVFRKEEVLKLSVLMRQALEKASPEQMVYFSIGGSSENTKGNVFSVDNKIYVHFLAIHGKAQETQLAHNTFNQWKLVEQEGQSTLRTKGILGIKGVRTDWVIVDLPGVTSLPQNASAPKVPENPKQENGVVSPKEKNKSSQEEKYGKVETKLRFLKEMLSEGLITQEDYQKKKEELLKEINQ